MTPDGVAVPMTLSHRMLGQLIGARRPTVSTALSDLIKHGQLMRRDDSTWLLIGEPVGVPAAQVARVIPMRRQLLRPEPPPAKQPPPEPVRIGDPEIRADLARLREQCSAHVARLEASYARTSSLAEQTIELRDICRSTRAGVRAARQRAQEPSGV